MKFWHSMICRTEGIRAAKPQWRSFDGAAGVYWDAEASSGATGYYLSPDPRIVVFFNDVSSHVRMSNRDNTFNHDMRGMSRAVYVPAGMPLWTQFTAPHRFSHLDLHIHKDRLIKYLAPTIGRSAALAAAGRPVEIQDASGVAPLASLLVDQLVTQTRPPLHSESLAGSIVTGLLDIIPQQDADASGGRLTQAQMNRLTRYVEAHDGRLTVGDLAAAVDLSESWFTRVFKQTNGKTPLQWLQARRIETAQALLLDSDLSLVDIAAQLGFCDQAHLTKAFRQVAGDTPAAWRRLQQAG